jgi:hypothetical protein
VISHGIPYIALIYIREIQQKEDQNLNRLSLFKSAFGIFLFILVILAFAFFEEFLWEILVWNEHFSLNLNVSLDWFQFLVPLLVVPQLTHYLLDGFIWRKPKKLINFVLKVKTYENAEVPPFIHAFVGIFQFKCSAEDIL